jgi:short-subunit dehydrogenase
MLLADGVKVWGTARDQTRLAPLAVRVGFKPVVLDLEKPAEAEAAFCSAEAEAGGSFDLVVNNAGYGVFAPFAAVDHSVWQTQLDAMLGTTSRLTHAALRSMATRDRGCIVNTSSLATDFPIPFMSGYNVAKAGLSALTESLMFETRGSGVVLIDFRPGDLQTGFNQAIRPTTLPPEEDRGLLDGVWQTLEKNLNAAPDPSYAVKGLRKAILRQKSGTVRCGSFFQAQVAPFLVRLAPASLRRAVMARYFGIS